MSPMDTSPRVSAADAFRKAWAEIEKTLAGMRDALERLLARHPELPEPEFHRAERDLRAAVLGLQGARLGEVSLGAGELFVSFEHDGAWIVGTGGSHWALTRGGEVVVQDSDDEEHLRAFSDVRGGRVIHAAARVRDRPPNAAAFKIALEQDWGFVIVGSATGVAADLPVFELRTPDDRYLMLFGDGVVNEVRADVPIPELIETGGLHRWPSAV